MKKYIFWMLLISCQSNEADAPELITKDAQQIGATSAVLEAEITEVGPVRPINYGFLWDIQPDITISGASNKHIIGQTSEPKLFSIKIDNLNASTSYHYRSFAANADYSKLYYGKMVTFTTLP